MAKTNLYLTDDGEAAKEVTLRIDDDKYFDPGHPARQNSYRLKIRKELMAARYRDWLREKRLGRG